MYGTGIIELRKITENQWKAKYQGNYGVYTIKLPPMGRRPLVFPVPAPAIITLASTFL